MNTLKSVCFYHSDQIITNFCKDKNCLMPLCPSCIGEHTSYHEQTSSKPLYNNIYEVLSEAQTLLCGSICALELDKKRITQLNRKIGSINDLITQRLNHAKNVVYSIVQESFRELQSELKGSLARLHEQIGLYSPKKTQKLEEGLSSTLHQLYEINEGLKSQKFLGHLIIFLKQKEKDSAAFHNKLNSYLQSNQSYSPQLEINNEAKVSLSNSIGRILKVQSKKDYDRRKQSLYEPKGSLLKHKRSNKDYYEKNQKIQRSYTPQRSSIYNKSTVQPSKAKVPLASTNSPYAPAFSAFNGQLLRDRTELTSKRYYQPVQSQALLSHFNIETSEIGKTRDFKQQYEMLSRKVSQMRRQSQTTNKSYQ